MWDDGLRAFLFDMLGPSFWGFLGCIRHFGVLLALNFRIIGSLIQDFRRLNFGTWHGLGVQVKFCTRAEVS